MSDIVPGSLTGFLTSEDNELTGTLAGALVRGFSAYQIAVLKGFVGTEEEWLASLKGDSPVRGVDYWTTADKNEIIEDVLESEEITDIAEEVRGKEDALVYSSPQAGFALVAKTIVNGKVTEWEFSESGGLKIHICSSSEYGQVDRVPIIEHPDDKTIYLVPVAEQDRNNLFVEWVYVNNAWEIFGSASIEIPVTDVQVNGTSVVNDGVAEIPVAKDNALGIAMFNSSYGLRIAPNGTVILLPAQSQQIKDGNMLYSPITTSKQHESAFYGLAKAAGHDEKNSALAVGTYTPEAKAAIQSMLGIDSAIADAIGQITSFEFQVVTELPVTGTKGVIYLVAHSHGTSDIYDEYIWVTDKYERLGTLDIDLSNYVTFDDYATRNKAGVVKVFGMYGLSVSSDGTIYTVAAGSSMIQSATHGYAPIVPFHQHESTFYGLAKVAGDTTQSQSSNAVGTYTNEAKAAIKAMLDISGECQTVTVTGTTPVITATQNTRYVCGEVTSLDFTPSANGICDVIFTSGSTVTVLTLPSTVILPSWFDATALEANTTYEISISDGVYGAVIVW